MRTSLKAEEIYHFWANETQPTGNCGNVSFSNGTLYSYGTAIARIVTLADGKKVTLFDSKNYSSSTSTHQGRAESANWHPSLRIPVMPDYTTNEILQSDADYATKWKADVINSYIKGIANIAQELQNPRIKNVLQRKSEISEHIGNILTFCKYFNYTIPDTAQRIIDQFERMELAEALNGISAAQAEKQAAEEKRAAERLKKQKAALRAEIAKWRNFKKYDYTVRNAPVALRYNAETKRIETSMGVEAPVGKCQRLYKIVKTMISKGKSCDGDCNMPLFLDSYQIRSISKDRIVIGCHDISMKEIERMATQLNW